MKRFRISGFGFRNQSDSGEKPEIRNPKSEIKSLLIITPRFWPLETPRGHRWTKLAAEITGSGLEVTVVTCRKRGRPDLDLLEKVEIRRAGHATFFDFLRFHFLNEASEKKTTQTAKKPSVLLRFAHFLRQNVFRQLSFPDESIIWRGQATRAAQAVLAEKKIDAVISVSMPFAANLVARRLKKARPELIWLCDIGDPLAIHDKNLVPRFSFFEKMARQLERDVLAECDAATVTNDPTRARFEAFFGPQIGRKIAVAPPVFELENWSEKSLTSSPSTTEGSSERLFFDQKKLNLAFFGSIYGSIRPIEAVLDFLEKTEKSRPELARRLAVHFFGAIKPEFLEPLLASPRVILHGKKSRPEAQRAMRETDVLLNLGNRADYLLPSKSVEYLAARRPVLHFSNTANDPFSDFFERRSTVFLNVSSEAEKVSSEQLEKIWAWLEAEKMPADEAATARALEPFLAQNVAKTLLDALKNAARTVE